MVSCRHAYGCVRLTYSTTQDCTARTCSKLHTYINKLYVLNCGCSCARYHEGCSSMLTRHVPCEPPSSHSTHAVIACTIFSLCESTSQSHFVLSSSSPIMSTFEYCDIAYPMPEALFSVEQSRHLNDIQPYKQLQACNITTRGFDSCIWHRVADNVLLACSLTATQAHRAVLSADSFIG
jgi:hypothetical protein